MAILRPCKSGWPSSGRLTGLCKASMLSGARHPGILLALRGIDIVEENLQDRLEDDVSPARLQFQALASEHRESLIDSRRLT